MGHIVKAAIVVLAVAVSIATGLAGAQEEQPPVSTITNHAEPYSWAAEIELRGGIVAGKLLQSGSNGVDPVFQYDFTISTPPWTEYIIVFPYDQREHGRYGEHVVETPISQCVNAENHPYPETDIWGVGVDFWNFYHDLECETRFKFTAPEPAVWVIYWTDH